jgi:hypothetical protein
VVMATPKEKASEPDGYIEIFFSHCWNVIKEDILMVVDQFCRTFISSIKPWWCLSLKIKTPIM